jgi:hypothetical protein
MLIEAKPINAPGRAEWRPKIHSVGNKFSFGCASWTLSGEQHSDPPNVLHDAQDELDSLILSAPSAD